MKGSSNFESSINELLDKVYKLKNEKNYDASLSCLIESDEIVELSPQLLVEKGRLIQLSSEEISLDLQDAIDCFKRALLLDEEHAPALIELGYFYLNVEDDVKQAKSFFSAAMEKVVADNGRYIEAFQGYLDCILEIDGPQKAIEALEKDKQLDKSEKDDIKEKLQDGGVVFWD